MNCAREILNGYRYGFNGQEKDDEWKGEGNSINYKARIYDTRLGKFLSVDPLTSSFSMLTPYQFASNTPIWAVDLDGLEARIYTDLTTFGAPHSFISVVDDNDIIHVYTYGSYGVDGALVHLVGSAANDYIKGEFEKYPMATYEISEALIDYNKVIDYYTEKMEGNQRIPETDNPDDRKELSYTYKYDNDGSSAVYFENYAVFPFGKGNENCSSCVLDGTEAGGYKITTLPVPQLINELLWEKSWYGDNIFKVTDNEDNAAKGNMNSGMPVITLDEFVVTP